MTTRLVIDIRNYKGERPLRFFDPEARIIRKIDNLSAWIETPRPDRWGYAPNGKWLPNVTDPEMRGTRVFPADSLEAAKRQVDTWRWNDQAALDA